VDIDPVVISLESEELLPFGDDERRERLLMAREAVERGVEYNRKAIPVHYAEAVADVPAIRDWVRDLVSDAVRDTGRAAVALTTGRSLLILGPTGTGKTFQAYGAVRALSLSGLMCSWQFSTAADIYARLRPRPRVDSEEEFRSIANTRLLVIDDLGAAKSTEWTEEVDYRLINHRYERELPTLITSNVKPADLKPILGDRVTSRLVEMTTRVVLKGDDRRRGGQSKGAA
jgi:DNA replication protein DnaC